MLYTIEGKEISGRLWMETVNEFSFAGVQDVLRNLKSEATTSPRSS